MTYIRKCPCCGSETLTLVQAILMPYVAYKAFGIAPTEITEAWGLSSVKQGTSYFPCHSAYCLECGMVFCDLRFDPKEEERLYEGYRNAENTRLRQLFEPTYAVHKALPFLDKVEEFLAPLLPENPRILDWGGDDGSNTPFRGKWKWLHIYDIGTNPMVCGKRASEGDMMHNVYDLIVCSNVLEHVSDLDDFFFDFCFALRKDTILYIEVPYENIMYASPELKHHWHEHINFFSEKSLRALFERNGLNVIKQQILKVNPGSSAEHVLMFACRRK